MADIRQRRESDEQPLGWTERRSQLRLHSGGKVWRQIILDFDPGARTAKRLAILAELEIDFLTRDELYDYLTWFSDELEIDISDMYRMYLGYEVGEAQAVE